MPLTSSLVRASLRGHRVARCGAMLLLVSLLAGAGAETSGSARAAAAGPALPAGAPPAPYAPRLHGRAVRFA